MAYEKLFTLEEASALFKIKYEKLSENVYNSANVLLGRVKKSYNFVGEKIQITIPSSFSGGVGSGSLPKANVAMYKRAELQSKKMYAVVEIDRETIKAALKDEGSFVRATKEVVKKGVESFMRNMSRCLFNDASGILGEVESVSGNTVTIKDISASDNGFKEANFEERDLINLEVAVPVGSVLPNTQLIADGTKAKTFEIVEVKPESREVILSSVDGGLAAGDKLIMQGSKNADPEGLKGVLLEKNRQTVTEADGTSGAGSFGIVHKRRWKATQEDAQSAAVSTDLLNKVMLKIKKSCGKSPNLIVTSYKQYEKILNLLEDQKRYSVPTRAGLKSKSGADISFSGVEFMSIDGPIGIFPERFVEDDTIYLLNDAHIHIHHRPDFGWFDDDGTVFLRKADEDAYEARYGGYLQTYINPCFHGVIHNLSV